MCEAIDGKPVHALFTVISPSVPVHLRILGQLGLVLRDEELRGLLAARRSPEEILGRIRALEARGSGMHPSPTGVA